MSGRLLKRILGAALVLIAIVLIVAWLGLRASLPQLDGEVTITGIDDVATSERDADGIPVITASSRKDLA